MKSLYYLPITFLKEAPRSLCAILLISLELMHAIPHWLAHRILLENKYTFLKCNYIHQ